MLSVSKVLNAVAGNYIKWPEAENFNRIATKFRNSGGFPNTLAAVDGSHIKISAPCHNAASYVNRKGYICLDLEDDVNEEILNGVDEQMAQNIPAMHEQDGVHNAAAIQKRINIMNMLMQEIDN